MRLLRAITLLVVLAACRPESDPAGEPPSQAPTESPGDQPTLAQSREQVRSTTQDVLALMVSDKGPFSAAKPSLAFANGVWTACTDDLVGWAYDGSGVSISARVTAASVPCGQSAKPSKSKGGSTTRVPPPPTRPRRSRRERDRTYFGCAPTSTSRSCWWR